MTPQKWHHAAILGGGVAVLGMLLYYLMHDDTKQTKSAEVLDEPDNFSKVLCVHTATKAEVEQVLKKIVESQEKMKQIMKILCTELAAAESYTFDEVYKRVLESQPDDPLELTGLTMMEFDTLLGKYENDESIREIINTIMLTSPPDASMSKIETVPVSQIIEIHGFMLDTLKNLSQSIKSSNYADTLESRTATIAAQAIISTEVEKRFSFTNNEIEAAIYYHHQALSEHPEFSTINTEIQREMTEMMGCSPDAL